MIIDVTGSFCAANIRYLRKKYCVSRRGLARLIGMSEITLRDIEAETFMTVFRYREFRRLCAVFDMTIEQLVHCDLAAGQTEPPPDPFIEKKLQDARDSGIGLLRLEEKL